MADPIKDPNQTPLEADERGRVLEALSKGFLPESDDFFNFIGRGASYYKTKPASQRSMWDNLVRHSVFGGPDPNEIKAQTEQKAIIDYAKGVQKQFEGLPTAQEAGGFFRGGQLPFTPTTAQQQPIIPTSDELSRIQEIEKGPLPQGWEPLQAPIQPGQIIGMDPTQFNPQSRLTPFQSGILEEAGKGQTVLPGQQFLPTTLAKTSGTKLDTDLVEAFDAEGKPVRILVNKQTGEIIKGGLPGKPQAGPLSVTNVNTYTPASVEAQKDFIKSARTTYDQLKSAPALLQNLDEAKAIIPKAKMFMGPFGETKLNITKFLRSNVPGFEQFQTEGVKNSQELRTRIFFNVLENLKKMDAQPSQKQQEIMMQAFGDLDTDAEALGAMLDAYRDLMTRKIQSYNEEVTGAERRGVKFPYNPVIKLPKSVAAAQTQQTQTGVASFNDPDKEKRYQEWKAKHK